MNGGRGRKKGMWNVEVIRQTQRQIKATILSSGASEKERLHWILEQLFALNSSRQADAPLRCFILSVSALTHHWRHGGLSEKQIDLVSKIALSILHLNGVQETSAPHSFLYADILQALARIHRKSGDFWLACWEHEASLRHASSANLDPAGVTELGSAIRKIRLGDVINGIEMIEQALSKGLDAANAVTARLNLIKAMRLVGRYDDASAVDTQIRQQISNLDVATQRELTWEKTLRDASRTGNMRLIAEPIIRKGIFVKEWAYVIEGFFWLNSCQETKYRADVKAPRLIKRAMGDAGTREDAQFVEYAICIEECHDATIPFSGRVQKLGRMLADVRRLLTIDREALVLAAAVRWLARNRSYPLMDLVLKEYVALCLKMTLGSSEDVLALLSDILADRKDLRQRAS